MIQSGEEKNNTVKENSGSGNSEGKWHTLAKSRSKGVKPTIFCTAHCYDFYLRNEIEIIGMTTINIQMNYIVPKTFVIMFRAFVIKDNSASVLFLFIKLIWSIVNPPFQYTHTHRNTWRYCSKWKIRLQHFILDDILSCLMDLRRRRQTGADIWPPSWGKNLTNEFSYKENPSRVRSGW